MEKAVSCCWKRLTLCLSLCSQGQLRRTCLAACCVFLAQVRCCWTPMAPPSRRPRARPGVWRSCPVTQVGSHVYSDCFLFVFFVSWFLHLISMTVSKCVFACMCVYTFMFIQCSGELGHQVWLHYIPYQKCVHTSVIIFLCACLFQDRSAFASKRQLGVSLEGPPGVFAPVV